jgi:O-antigen/teichoic acid export membrane protein
MWLKFSLLNSTFNKNVAVLFAGTSIAQAIPLAISPILTRLYSPEEFGLFALFFSITNLLGVVAAGRYELAIVLPKEEREAEQLEQLCFTISICMGIILFLIILLFQEMILEALGTPDLRPWLFFIPISVCFVGLIQTYSYRLNRNRQFKQISFIKVSQNTTTGAASLILGITRWLKNGLIIGHLFGQFVTILFQWRNMRRPQSLTSLKSVAQKYRSFAFINAPGALLNTAASSLPVFYLSKILTRGDVGFYGLVERSIGAPISLISYSISQVLLEEIAARHREGQPVRTRLFRLVLSLAGVGFIPFGILFFFAQDIFAFVFGSKWFIAGQYAAILSLAFFFRFVVSPLSVVLISTNNLRLLVVWQFTYFVTTLGVVLFSIGMNEAKPFLVALAINDVALYSLYLFLIFWVVKR